MTNKDTREEQDTEERESSITDMLRSLSVVRECVESNPYSKESMKEKTKDMDEKDKIREALESQFK